MALSDVLTRSAGGEDSPQSVWGVIVLVLSAVLVVVFVCLPGYISARMGLFNKDKQKFLANLNTYVFTPCLIFTKLGSQLSINKLADLVVIPVIFVIQTFVSWACSRAVSRAYRLGRRPTNFVTAMAVFGNSNSLPVSLVVAFAKTIKGLHWDRIPGDNDGDVAARGILYLLLFQQLGLMVRWTWGANVLLAPKSSYDEYKADAAERGDGSAGRESYTDADTEVGSGSGSGSGGSSGSGSRSGSEDGEGSVGRIDSADDLNGDRFWPSGVTPIDGGSRGSPAESDDEDGAGRSKKPKAARDNFRDQPLVNADADVVWFPHVVVPPDAIEPDNLSDNFKVAWRKKVNQAKTTTKGVPHEVYTRLPAPMQKCADSLETWAAKVYGFLEKFMNPPLWAMVLAVIVASFPSLQKTFFSEGFVHDSLGNAIELCSDVAVPLILVVLGANLGLKEDADERPSAEEAEIGTKLVVASLVSRMLLPTLVMAPVLALFAKFVPLSILDDPIFVVVCFLLMGAPSALQLAQICQVNGVYERVIPRILFQSYVVWVFPSTIVLVVTALEVVKWAAVN